MKLEPLSMNQYFIKELDGGELSYLPLCGDVAISTPDDTVLIF